MASLPLRNESSLSLASPAAPGWPHHIGILNDYVRIPYANGSSFASQRLYREFRRRGHTVTVLGPRDPAAGPGDLPARSLMLPSLPLENHPGVYLPMPSMASLKAARQQNFDLLLCQTGSAFTELAVWLRKTERVPFLCVNTIHLPSVYNVVLPDGWHDVPRVRALFERFVIPRLERQAARIYNRSDGLIVLSRGLEMYWRARGVTAPIFVIPRSVDVDMFAERGQPDPFDPRATPGGRLLVLCRHTREKGLARLLQIFATQIAPHSPDATLTLVGDGPDHDAFKALAKSLKIDHRTFFPGECSAASAPAYYRHADLFVYTSLSETYGQVVSEAAFCGLPAVALADDMGVSHQIEHERTGILITPTPEPAADRAFGEAVCHLLANPLRRRAFAESARRSAFDRCGPAQAVERHYAAFEAARSHCQAQDTRDEPLGTWRALSRWAGLHALAYLTGLLRAPAVVNRHKRQAPPWDEGIEGALGPLCAP